MAAFRGIMHEFSSSPKGAPESKNVFHSEQDTFLPSLGRVDTYLIHRTIAAIVTTAR